ncbi:MAG TPA: hypothetical protein VJT13_04315 [Xanthobacteraceae bacterium]|nr:hypothetical protein [Xanthobacteraceae bacterium]
MARAPRVARATAMQFIARMIFQGEDLSEAERFFALRKNPHGTRVFTPSQFSTRTPAHARGEKFFRHDARASDRKAAIPGC